MNQALMRRLDFWLGAVLCMLLTFAGRLRSALLRKRAFAPPRKILFIKLIEQGATVIAYDAIREAIRRVGRENVYFAVFRENRAILDLMDVVPKDNVIALRHARPWELALDLGRLVWRCRRDGIDTTIDMEFFARGSAIIAYLTGARIRAGLHRFTAEAPYRGDLMTHRMPYNPYLHVAVAYRSLVDYAFLDPDQRPLFKADVAKHRPKLPRFVASPAEQAEMRVRLDAQAGRPLSGPLVLLNPNAGDLLPLRRWETGRFHELARRLLAQDPKLAIGVTGAPSEQQAVKAFCQGLPPDRVIPLAGKTSLRELFVLYTVADVLVTNDSGPGHFSSMTGINSIVLFGPETPALFGPLSPNSRTIWRGLSCSPCVSAINHRLSPCSHGSCMEAITVDEVFAEVLSALDKDVDTEKPEIHERNDSGRAGGSGRPLPRPHQEGAWQ